MTKKIICPHCEAMRECGIVAKKETVTIKGREVSFDAVLTRCTTCATEFEAAGQLDANLLAAREAYDRLYGTPSPEAITALRSRYNASQKAFGTVLGFGELTVNSYEQGQTPDSTNRLLLKLAENPGIFKAMYDINKDRLGAIQRRRIEESEGYQEALSWQGVDGLRHGLTTMRQEMLNTIVSGSGKSVVEQTTGYVEQGIFKDYSDLVQHTEWSGGLTMQVKEAGIHFSGYRRTNDVA